MRSTLAALAWTLFVAGCAEQATQPSTHPDFAAATDGERVTIRDVYTSIRNDCSGELIELRGRVQYLWRIVSLPNGHFHITNNFSLHLKGQGLTNGDEYNGTLMGNFTETVLPGLVMSNVFHLRLIGQGKAPNVLLDQVVHWTITPNGQFVVDRFEWSIHCSQLPEVTPPALSIESITRTVPGAGEVPVDLNAVAGPVNVWLILEANNNPIDHLDLLLDTETADSVVASQSFSLATVQPATGLEPDTLALSFNTAAFSLATGAAGFVNRLHMLRGRLFLTDQPESAAEDSTRLTLANRDTAIVSVGVQGGGQASDQLGQTWLTGSAIAVALPIIYSTASPTIGQVNFEPSGGLYVKVDATSPFGVAWDKGTAIGLGGAGGEGLLGVETANFVVTVSATVNGIPSGPLGASPSFRYDNNGPGAPWFAANPNLRQNGWINGTVGLTGSNTSATDNDWLIDGTPDGGVGGYVRELRIDGTAPGTVDAANAAAASSTPAMPAPSLNNNDYCAVASARDLLDNESRLPLAGTVCLAPPVGFVPTGSSHLRFGVDLAEPVIAFSGGLGSNARLNGSVVGAEFQVTVSDTGTFGNSGLLSGSAVLGTVQIRSAALTPPSASSCFIGAFSSGTCNAVSVNPAPALPLVQTTSVAASATVGYYTYSAFAQDAAGNQSAPVSRVIAFDPAVEIPALTAALFDGPLTGPTAAFSAFASDNFDLWKSGYALSYAGGFAGPLLFPSVLLNAFNATPLLNSNVPAGITIDGFVRQIEDVTGNNPLTVGGQFKPTSLSGVVLDQANNSSANAVTAIAPAAVTTGVSFTAAAAAQLINTWVISSPAASVLVSDNAGPAPPVNPLSVVINADAFGPTGTFFPPFTRVDFYALVGGNLQQIGSTTTFSLNDNGSPFGRRGRYTFTWTPGTGVPLGPQTIYAVGVNSAGDGLVTTANTNISTANP